MDEPDTGPPVVPLPRPVDRRLRLGPFASAQDAAKFAAYAAAGAILGPLVSAYAWLPVLGVGFLLSTWRPDGEALDERVGHWVAWRLRHFAGEERMNRRRALPRERFLRTDTGQYLAVLRSGGTPLAYRPPVELERVFRSYGELLRASTGVLLLHVGTVPVVDRPLLPEGAPDGEPARPAQQGYRELVSILCRRRRVRRVDLAIASPDSRSDGPTRIDQSARRLATRLEAFGLRPGRLSGRALAVSAHRFGWSMREAFE